MYQWCCFKNGDTEWYIVRVLFAIKFLPIKTRKEE